MSERFSQAIVTILLTSSVASILTVILIFWIVDPMLTPGAQVQTGQLFSLAILGLYLVAIIMAAVTLWATLMGPSWITDRVRKIARNELEETKRDDVGRTTFYIGYVYGTLGDTDPRFLDEAADFAKNAHRYLPDDSALKTSALNNWVFFESRRGRNSAIADEIVAAATSLRRQYMADRDFELATTYAMAVLTYGSDFVCPEATVDDAERLLTEVLANPHPSEDQKHTARERLAQLRALERPIA